jgi:hypothetical protein
MKYPKTLGLLLVLAALTACSGKDEPAKTSSSSIACYIDVQFRCKEFPEATSDQLANLPVECSSASGALTKDPAACPKAGFLGKCTVGTSGKDKEVRRFYTGADAAYEQDFCVNTAKGVWATTF